MDFNNLPETRFDDVKRVLRTSAQRVAARLKQPQPWCRPISGWSGPLESAAAQPQTVGLLRAFVSINQWVFARSRLMAARTGRPASWARCWASVTCWSRACGAARAISPIGWSGTPESWFARSLAAMIRNSG